MNEQVVYILEIIDGNSLVFNSLNLAKKAAIFYLKNVVYTNDDTDSLNAALAELAESIDATGFYIDQICWCDRRVVREFAIYDIKDF